MRYIHRHRHARKDERKQKAKKRKKRGGGREGGRAPNWKSLAEGKGEKRKDFFQSIFLFGLPRLERDGDPHRKFSSPGGNFYTLFGETRKWRIERGLST